MANVIEFQQPKALIAHWNTSAERFDGTVVPDALSDAEPIRLIPRIQGLVCESPNRND